MTCGDHLAASNADRVHRVVGSHSKKRTNRIQFGNLNVVGFEFADSRIVRIDQRENGGKVVLVPESNIRQIQAVVTD